MDAVSLYESTPVTYWDRLSCASVPCPDRCSRRRVRDGVGVGWPCCSGSDTVLSTPVPESNTERINNGDMIFIVSEF